LQFSIAKHIPAGVIGVVFGDWLNDNLYNYQTVAITLILYGVLFIIIENRNRSKVSKIVDFDTLSFKTAFLIGCFQVLSLVPGTSRSGATILGGIILGTSRSIAAEFSFFLSIPVMFGASLLKIVKFGFNFTNTEFIVLVTGMLTAFLVSIIAIQFLLKYIKNHDFKVFGWYRIVLGAIVLLYFGFK
jgi:undecaprenyl-diphosphatase